MIDLKDLRHLLVNEISKAEVRVIQAVHMSLAGAKEDDITALFVVEAERGLKEATESGRVAAAVRSDLERGYRVPGYSPPHKLKHSTEGLIARVRRQQPVEEKRTGGDFGLLLVEPQFQVRWDAQLNLQRGGLKRGLLVQAKRRYRNGRWNQFTATQVRLLPERIAYTALLRYEFLDPSRRNLRSFYWHPLSGHALSAVAQWLASGDFPNAVTTSAVVEGLSNGEYGTDDQDIIERDICSDTGSYVVIEIDWKDDEDPEDLVVIINREIAERAVRRKEQVQVKVRA